MSQAFYDFVRGRTDALPDGYEARGMQVYRHLVYLGASQMIEACYPQLKTDLGEEDWRMLIEDFVRQSAWGSHFYGDLDGEFKGYLDKVCQSASSET